MLLQLMSTLAASQPVTPEEDESTLKILAVGGCLLIAVIAIVSRAVRAHQRDRQMEETKREVAAYVAEGSIKPEDAARIINAGGQKSKQTDD